MVLPVRSLHASRQTHPRILCLWGDAVIGWANVGTAEPRLSIELGFVERQPKGREFRRELDAEIERLEAFLVPRPTRAGTGRPTATSSKRR